MKTKVFAALVVSAVALSLVLTLTHRAPIPVPRPTSGMPARFSPEFGPPRVTVRHVRDPGGLTGEVKTYYPSPPFTDHPAY